MRYGHLCVAWWRRRSKITQARRAPAAGQCRAGARIVPLRQPGDWAINYPIASTALSRPDPDHPDVHPVPLRQGKTVYLCLSISLALVRWQDFWRRPNRDVFVAGRLHLPSKPEGKCICAENAVQCLSCGQQESRTGHYATTRAAGELQRLETQSGLSQASFVIGPVGRLPFRLSSALQATNPRRHLDGPTMEEHGATQDQHGVPAQNTTGGRPHSGPMLSSTPPRSGCHLRICPRAVNRVPEELDLKDALEGTVTSPPGA